MNAGRDDATRFDELVEAVTPRVLAEALEQAVDRARGELGDRLARAIVDRALGAAPSGSQPDVPPEPSPDTGLSDTGLPDTGLPDTGLPDTGLDTGLYAFGIIPAGPVDLAGVTGIDGEAPLRIVQQGELGLVLSRMRLDLMDDVSETDLSETGALATLARRHDEVVRHVFERGPVLPLRFGTVVADEDGARRLLAEHMTVARARLAHLADHREWGVRVGRDADADASSGRTVADESEPAVRREMSGTDYLAARREALGRSQRAEQHATALTRHVEETLRDHATDVTHRSGGPELIADLAYLVAGEREADFLDAAERLRGEVAQEGLDVTLTGPWPPYSFATLESDPTGVRSVGQ